MALTDDAITHIKEMIMDGRLKPGQRLPPEKDLSDSLGLSRSSLREAVKALDLMGVLSVRRGDGTYVTSLDAGLLLMPMSFMVDLHDDDRGRDLHAVRRVLETETAGLAAGGSDVELTADLQEILLEAETELGRSPVLPERLMEIDIRFHRRIALAAGNRVLSALVDAMSSRTLRERMWRAINETGALERTHLEHQAILKALVDRDPEHARIRMANHLLGVEQFVSDSVAPVPIAD